MVWQYYAVLINGITFHEIACGSQLLISMALENPKQLKFPVFWACVASNISSFLGILDSSSNVLVSEYNVLADI
jgi:hypothetical protein